MSSLHPQLTSKVGLLLSFVALTLLTPSEQCAAQSTPEPDAAGLVVEGLEIVGGSLDVIDFILEPLINQALQGLGARTLFEIRGVQDILVQDDAFVEVAVYNGLDLDGDPSDDFSGSEEFEVDPVSLDGNGDPLALLTPGNIVAGLLTVGPGDITIAGLTLTGVELSGVVGLAGTSFVSQPFVTSIPSLIFEQIPAPFPFTGTALDVLAFFGTTPDVDLDMDGTNDAFSADIAVTATRCIVLHPDFGIPFQRGDCDGSGDVGFLDAIFNLNVLFVGAGPAPCVKACDFNDDGSHNLVDAVNHLSFQFIGGAPPEAPFPDCGVDTTLAGDDLSCELFAACP